MTTTEIVDTLLTCKETDFSAIIALTSSLSNHPDVRPNQIQLIKNIEHAGNLVKNHSIGEGILVGENEEGLIDCIVTFGITDYSYITNDGYFRNNSYKTLMIDLIGRLKDGDITILDLFLRRNTSPGGSIEPELEYIVPSGDTTVNLKAVDKHDLSTMMELSCDASGEEGTVLDWFDRIYGVVPVCDLTVGHGKHMLISSCNLYGTVTKTMFDNIEEVVDKMLVDTVIYLSMDVNN